MFPLIIFLNQMAGPLFRELAEDLAEACSPGILYTGHPDTIRNPGTPHLEIQKSPVYKRKNYKSRIISWIHYFFFALIKVFKHPKSSYLFIITNPPFLGVIGLISKSIRSQRYSILVYDIHPDLLINLGKLNKKGFIARFWKLMNRLTWENAEIVFTIGEDMAEKLEELFNAKKTKLGKVAFIPNWADVNFIKPIPKEKNWFAKKHGQVEKITVLYSGNLGATHDIETIIYAAKGLQQKDQIHFLLIGEGEKLPWIEKFLNHESLKNVTLLPFQPEQVLPYSLTTGDIAVVTMEAGIEGLMVPSKIYYSLTAGIALIVLAEGKSEIIKIVQKHQCGMCLRPGDVNGLKAAILRLVENPNQLERYKKAARDVAERYYSRRNTQKYVDLIRAVSPHNQ